MTTYRGHRKVEFMFAYGMNTNLTSMLLRCRNAKCLGKAWLPDYRLDFRYHLDITESKFDKVEGVLWELEEDDLALIDQVEGYPEYYSRHLLQPYKERYINTYPAWTYAMQVKHDLQEPDQRYWDLVLEGYDQNKIPSIQLENALDRVYNQDSVA
jgi:gamma-glutamylcyclotransferase (GGCT)/AIG2-like uncharacterized protein YtfP